MHGFEFSQTSITIKSYKIPLPLLQVKLENISKNQECSKLLWGRAPPPRRELPPSPQWPHMPFTHFYYYLLMSDQYIVCNYLIVILGWLILSKVQNYIVSVNFPIYLDPRNSLSEKNSKHFHVYYPRKQDLVLYYELLRGKKRALNFAQKIN